MEGRVTGSDVFLAFLAYFPVLGLIPLAKRRKDRFLLYHARQGLYMFTVFLFLAIVAGIALWFFATVLPNQFLAVLFSMTLILVVVGYVVLVILMAGSVLQRRMWMLPVLGELAGER